jgi:hypothetical protein
MSPAATVERRSGVEVFGEGLLAVGLLNFDELMAGLVPDRGRGDWPRRGFDTLPS